MTQSLSFHRNRLISAVFPLRQPTDGELIGVEKCSCADSRTVRVLNQKVSLLLITHNATNSRGLSFPQAPLNILAATQRGRKTKNKENNLHTIITVGRADVCLRSNISGGGASQHTQHQHASRPLLLHPRIRQKCSESRCLEEREAPEIQEEEEEEEAEEGEEVAVGVGEEGCGG